MAVNMKVIVNKVNASVDYQTTPANYVEMDLVNDYLIWTEGDDPYGAPVIEDGDDEPTESELNLCATIIDPSNPKTVAKCFVYDKDDGIGTVRLVDGMGASDKRYVFGFSFDGATASEPQLEAWDDINHNTINFHVLGNGTPANSMVKADCTTVGNPVSYQPLAGASNVLLLNDGSGALGALPSGQTTQELYANLKIVIPAGYTTPGVEPFILTCRYTWN